MINIDSVIVDGSNVSKTSLRALLHELQDGSVLLNFTAAPNVAITATASATAGAPNGTYYYLLTFVTAAGETDGNAPSAAVSPASKQVSLTNIQVSSDPAVIARRIYRTPASTTDSVLGQLVATINDNTTTTYTDNTPDGSLGAPIPRINGTGGTLNANGQPFASGNSLSTRFGKGSQQYITGYACSSFGANSLNVNTTGYRNTAIGVDAMQLNTTGYENTAVGVHALGGSTTGVQNNAFGYIALGGLTTGSFNCAFGTSVLNNNATASRNNGFGNYALQLHATGDSNNAFGTNALYALATGIGNTAFGDTAGATANAGNFNTLIGFKAAELIGAGTSNTAVGANALYNLAGGGNNVALGGSAGYWETGFNHLWIDNQQRANLADGKVKALIWGTFGTTPAAQELVFNAASVSINGLPTYADNAAATAGGLAVNRLYRTATGVVMIRY